MGVPFELSGDLEEGGVLEGGRALLLRFGTAGFELVTGVDLVHPAGRRTLVDRGLGGRCRVDPDAAVEGQLALG